ncbi:MAG: hypothetical protein KC731_17960, partial [Myxococcales bacterium]|nr:hypothetical protein [Myxococcales bacterium]
MTRYVRSLAALVFACATLLLAARAEASHFRYGNIAWKVPDPINAPLTVEFTVTHGWRSDFVDSVLLDFGDGQSESSTDVTIGTGLDAAGESYTIQRFVTTHTYASPGSYTAFFENCCRVGTLQNAPSADFRVEADLSLEADGSNTSGPISGIPVIIQMEIGGIRQFVLPVLEPDNDPIACRFSTVLESGIPVNPPTVNANPVTFVSPGCTIEWDLSSLTSANVGQKNAISIEVESTHAGSVSSTTIDYIIEFVPEDTVPTCTGSGNFTATVGQPFSHNLAFTEPGDGILNLAVNDAPVGSVTTPGDGSVLTVPYPTAVNFSWTPTVSDAGTSRLIQFVGTNATNLFGFCTLIITVPQCNGFGTPCSAGVGECASSGQIVCQGVNSVCSAVAGTPTAEVCDGLDNDCNGTADDAPSDVGQSCSSGFPGVCAAGTTACATGSLVCTPNVAPGSLAETCNNADDDCNGAVDEGFNLGLTCSQGIGACENTGTIVCDGMGGATCSATPGAPTTEICANDIDESCDGVLNDGCVDTDGDGIIDDVEILIGSDPNDADTDDDGVVDGQEPTFGSCVYAPSCFGDGDGDGLNSVLDPDSDNDGLLDGTEMGFDCSHPDTDVARCVPDADMGATTTDPLDADSDDGGVSDGSEDHNLDGKLDPGETDPTAGQGGDDVGVIDTDGDGLSDDLETFLGSDPNDADTDDDGVLDGQEPNPSVDHDGDGLIGVLDVDSDDDGLYDGTEMGLDCAHPSTDAGPPSHCTADGDGGTTTTSPLLWDTDGGGVADGSEDADLDGVVGAGELDPNDGSDDGNATDSDGDGLSDDLESFLGSDPNDADSDDDGVLDGDEPNPADDVDGDGLVNLRDVDSDDDGLYDGTELGLDCANPSTDPGPPSHCRPDADMGATTTHPLLADTDRGGVRDGSEDANLDGAVDAGELDPNASGDDQGATDSDGDGLSDDLEGFLGSDANDADSDDDGLLDGDEHNPADNHDTDWFINLLDVDSDDDGLYDGTEAGKDCNHDDTDPGPPSHCIPDADPSSLTSPLDRDTDRGGVIDGSEDHNLDGAVNGAETDPTAGHRSDDTDPENLDTDMDGLSDALETFIGSNPMDIDSDDDGLLDGDENNPADDRDGDGHANAADEDADGDGLFDGTENGLGCDHPATDASLGHCIPDGDMGATTTNHLDPDTDGSGTPDGEEDVDHDGVVDDGETDPNDPTDDGIECFVDAHCPDLEVCEDHQCQPGCRVDTDCDPAEFCLLATNATVGTCTPEDPGTGGAGGTGGEGGGDAE